MRKTQTNNIAERCCVQGQQHNGDGSCLDNCESNGDPLLSGQLEKVLTIITPASPLLTSISGRTNSCPNPMISLSHYFLIPFQTPTRRCPCQSRRSFQTPTHCGRKCGTGVPNGGVEGADIRRERQRREKVSGNVSEIKITAWFCSLTHQQWWNINIGTDWFSQRRGKVWWDFPGQVGKVCSRARK